MRQPVIIRDNIVSAEKVAGNFGIPLSRVLTIEKVLKESRRKVSRAKKHTRASVAGKKRSASKAK